jgi:hypothetical protein
VALGQAGLLGRAPQAIALLRRHWASLAAPGAAPAPSPDQTMEQLKQAAREAGVHVGGTKAVLLARLPRGVPPSVYRAFRDSAAAASLAAALQVAASQMEDGAGRFSKTGRICATDARAAPFHLCDDVLDALPHVVRDRRHQDTPARWYRTEAVAAAALALHAGALPQPQAAAIAAAAAAARAALQAEVDARLRRQEAAANERQRRQQEAAVAKAAVRAALEGAYAQAGVPAPPKTRPAQLRHGYHAAADYLAHGGHPPGPTAQQLGDAVRAAAAAEEQLGRYREVWPPPAPPRAPAQQQRQGGGATHKRRCPHERCAGSNRTFGEQGLAQHWTDVHVSRHGAPPAPPAGGA